MVKVDFLASIAHADAPSATTSREGDINPNPRKVFRYGGSSGRAPQLGFTPNLELRFSPSIDGEDHPQRTCDARLPLQLWASFLFAVALKTRSTKQKMAADPFDSAL